MADLVVTNIGLLATPLGGAPRAGAAQGEVQTLAHAAVAMERGVITYVGPAGGAPKGRRTVNAKGRLATPGLVDSHTHLVFGGWRQHEFGQKLAGVPYLDILAAGGGILSTVRATRAATKEELCEKTRALLAEMLCHGTTLCEAKSGYGLDTQTEIKQLEVVAALAGRQPVELVPTFLGAHALPEAYKDDREAYVRLVCEEMIPAVAANRLARYCDVFCEAGVFSAEESRRVLQAAKAQGLGLRVHADEIEAIGGSMLAAELGAVSAEHLICAPGDAIAAMAKAGVIGVLLPGTSFYLGKGYAPARRMLAAGMAVAVASDLNPGSSPCCHLQLAMNLACLRLGLTPAEALCAVTLNAAAAVGRAATHGSVEVGKQADLLLWDAPDLAYIFYRYGTNLVHTVVKGGHVITEGI